MAIDWTKPIEHIDGTPLIFGKEGLNPDPAGEYYLVREDGAALTPDQTGSSYTECLIARPNGSIWGTADRNTPAVRNRTKQPTPDTLTLRDQFAMAALTGIMADESPDVIYEAKGVAARAYRVADAMLAHRNREREA